MIVEVWCRPWIHNPELEDLDEYAIIGGVWVCGTNDPAGLLDDRLNKIPFGRALVRAAETNRTYRAAASPCSPETLR